ncbi:uncharacterized protein LOC143257042 isoform X2 [Tachypleus tridentatus]|uniref:uncharacterized protein LOC143257042 isoform X2 n=1 Tax=Tachypleus tridentatus TaxID=6853 RepID=UPI003FD40767
MYPTLPSPAAQNAIQDDHITIYVLLAGVAGGLVLAIVVMVCCKLCLRKKKPLTRQHVVFNRSSERQHTRARKYHSLDSSVSVEIETSCGFSDNTSSPSKEPKDQYMMQEYQLPVSGYMSPRSLTEQLPGIPETKTPEFESSGPRSPFDSYPGPAGSTSVSSTSRRSSGGGIQRQASLCISDEEDTELPFPRQSTGSDQSVICESLPSNEIGESNESRAQSSPEDTVTGTGLTKVSVVVHHREEQPVFITSESSPGSNHSSISIPKGEKASSHYSHSHSSLDSSSTRTVIPRESVAKHVEAKEASSQTILTNIYAIGFNDYFRVINSGQQPVIARINLEEYDYVSGPSKSLVPGGADVEEDHYIVDSSHLQVKEETHSRKGSVSSLDITLDGEGWEEVPTTLHKADSTESGILEHKMELYQKENLKTLSLSDNSTPEQDRTEAYRIRYNDTGSKEDVREEKIVLSTPESEEIEETKLIEDEHECKRQQYRDLWELRATFEEEEELQDILQMDEDDDLRDICYLGDYDQDEKDLGSSEACDEDKEKSHMLADKEKASMTEQGYESYCHTEEEGPQNEHHCIKENGNTQCNQEYEDGQPLAYSDLAEEERFSKATEKLPELDLSTSQATSFESYADFVYTDDGCTSPVECQVRITNNLLELPSYESRRHSYKNLLAKRLQRRYASDPTQPVTTSTDNSLDSMEGSSTDASRHTTSMDSTTTDNTDSTGDGQSHKLQQMKADSGYKSMSVDGNGKPPKLSRKQIQPAIDEDTITVLDCILDKGSFDVNGIKEPNKSLETAPEEQVKRKLEPSKERLFAYHKDPINWDRKKIKSAFRKRRQYLKSRHDSQTLSDGALQWRSDSLSDSQSISDSRQDLREKSSMFHRFFRSNRLRFDRFLMRDYSVDEKSDALFREFARSDPMYEVVSSRFLHGHLRMYQHYCRDQNNTSPRMSRKVLSPQLSIEEEPLESDEDHHYTEDYWQTHTRSHIQHHPQVAQAAGIPVIRLPMESDY